MHIVCTDNTYPTHQRGPGPPRTIRQVQQSLVYAAHALHHSVRRHTQRPAHVRAHGGVSWPLRQRRQVTDGNTWCEQ